MSQFFTLPTKIGQGLISNAIAYREPLTIATMAIGDGGGTLPSPDASVTRLVNEVRRGPINQTTTDPDNPNWIIAEQVLPPDVGGWTIREVGLYDTEGNLVAYGNYPETYKPRLSEGSSRTQTIRFVMEVTDTSAVTLKIDPSVVMASREYVDNRISAHEHAEQAHDASQISVDNGLSQVPDARDVSAALKGLGEFASTILQNTAVFDAVGTSEWSVPEVLRSGRRKARVIVVGGGGGGGYGGGGGGGYASGNFDLTGVSSVSVNVGAGGLGSLSSKSDGNTSSFGKYISATGGAAGSTSSSFSAGRSPGGRGAGGNINVQGGAGIASTGFGAGGSTAISTGAAPAFDSIQSAEHGTFPGGGGGGVGDSGSSRPGSGAPGIVMVEF